MDSQGKAREKLDVPTVAPIERKLANLTRQRPAIGPAPRSAVLDKLAAFLPQLANENQRLMQSMEGRPATDFDIEHVEDDGKAPYIEMDLTCGVLELRDEAALHAAERAMAGQECPAGSSGSGSDEEDSEEDSEEDIEDEAFDLRGVAGTSRNTGLRVYDGGPEGGGETPSDGEGAAGGCPETDAMECDAAGAGLLLKPLGRSAGASGRQQQGRNGNGVRGGRGGRGHANSVRAAAGRRKVAAKRPKVIEELS